MTTQIAVVGGGLTGAVAAIQLLREISMPFDISIVEPNERLGQGLAYGRAATFHLLNVRAGKLGIIAGHPSDFALWARDRSFGIRTLAHQHEPVRAFLPRQLFGSYVEERLSEDVAERPDVNIIHIRSSATRVGRSSKGFAITLEDRTILEAQVVVLATGYGTASGGLRYGRRPFAPIDPAEIRAAKSALFVGTGLTFVDEFLRLRSLGFRGTALAVSRRGLLPEVHRANEAPTRIDAAGHPNLRSLVKAFREAVTQTEIGASTAVDLVLGMREDAQSLWQSLDVREQRRFLRHLKPYWNVARHRLAPEIHAQVRRAMQSGLVRVAPGRVVDSGGGVLGRLSDAVEGPFDLVFDCTGTHPDIKSPLMTSLLSQGLAQRDAHGIGLSVSADGGVLTRAGPSSRLFALGPLGHGSLYEITAVPEIVAQCAAMARRVRSMLQSVNSEHRAPRDHRGGVARAG